MTFVVFVDVTFRKCLPTNNRKLVCQFVSVCACVCLQSAKQVYTMYLLVL